VRGVFRDLGRDGELDLGGCARAVDGEIGIGAEYGERLRQAFLEGFPSRG